LTVRIPVSTRHTITGAIIGAGARKGVLAVKWGVKTNLKKNNICKINIDNFIIESF
jgi:phosphate/sulfate permease